MVEIGRGRSATFATRFSWAARAGCAARRSRRMTSALGCGGSCKLAMNTGLGTMRASVAKSQPQRAPPSRWISTERTSPSTRSERVRCRGRVRDMGFRGDSRRAGFDHSPLRKDSLPRNSRDRAVGASQRPCEVGRRVCPERSQVWTTCGVRSPTASGISGSSMVNVVPTPGMLSSRIVPRARSIARFAIAKPSPEPATSPRRSPR